MIIEQTNTTESEEHIPIVYNSRKHLIQNTSESQTTNDLDKKKYSIEKIPRLPRELTPLAPFTHVVELGQRGPLFNGSGAKHDTGRYKIRSSDDENIKRAKKYAMEQSVKYVLMKQQQQQQRMQLEVLKKQQALSLMCRIYIGSINFELNETMLKQAFVPFGPVKAVSLSFDPVTNRHKGFAFLEYETPEAAQLSIEQMNGAILGGRNIKVGRPSNIPQAQPIIDQLTEEAKNYNRIYVASIHPDLTANDIQSVFEAFGKIKSCALPKDTVTNKHKGYGFIEYETVQAAHDAINSMNLFDLGGKYLRVGKAITPPEGLAPSAPIPVGQMPTATAEAVGTITGQLQTKEMATGSQPSVSTPQLISHSFVQGGPMAPTTVAAALSAVAYSGMTVATSVISNVMNSTSVIVNSIPHPSLASVPVAPITLTNSAGIFLPSTSISQPNILEEPPIPVGLKAEFEEKQQQNLSIRLFLPTDKLESTNNQKTDSTRSNTDDQSMTLSQQEELNVKGREQRQLLMHKLNQRRLESRVCLLRNMVELEDIDDTLEEELKDECSKYGEVLRVIIHTEQYEDDSRSIIVKIFVEFHTSKQAERAIESLNERYFGGRKIKAELYDQTSYEVDDLSG